MTATLAASLLIDQTADWCRRMREAVRCPPDRWNEELELVREGIRLRRQWDQTDPEAPERRDLLRLLPAAQAMCRQSMARSIAAAAEKGKIVEAVVRQVAEDDQHLAEILGDHNLSSRAAALAVECLRDDLHWLATQASILDGNSGVDLLSRILTEQEAIQRELDAWDGHAHVAAGHPSDETKLASGAESLRPAAAGALRVLALGRRIESLLGRPDPQDCQGWYDAWQGTSRLAARLALCEAEARDEPSGGTLSAEAIHTVAQRRDQARTQWLAGIRSLAPDASREALRRAADDLADTAAEFMTFIEDTPLTQAVRTLEILREDAATCIEALDGGAAEPPGLKRVLLRRRRAIEKELQDRRLAWRMESLFGHRFVAALERLVLSLLILFVIMLAVEGPLVRYEKSHWGSQSLADRTNFAPRGSTWQPTAVETVFAWLDLGICLVLLADFVLKLSLADGRWLYLRRYWITGLLPVLPVGFLAYATHQWAFVVEEGDLFVLLRAFPYLRLPETARWLEAARPALRAARLVGFLIWASDRLVRRLSPLLNRNLVLFERASLDEAESPCRAALTALRERFHHRAAGLVGGLSPRARQEFLRVRIDDLAAMLESPRLEPAAADGILQVSAAREVLFEEVVARFISVTPAGISEQIGRNLAQSIARWCRAFDLFAVRRLPVVRDLVAAGRLANPLDATAQAANRLGLVFGQMLERVYWIADFYGTVTAPQLVDSVGEWMIRRTAVPTRRFLMFGGLFVILFYLASLLPFTTLHVLSRLAERLVGTPLIVLGILCMFPLLLGLWFRQIANEATDFFTRVAEAQFITGTRDLKRRLARRHHAFLYRRVLAPESDMAGRALLHTGSKLPVAPESDPLRGTGSKLPVPPEHQESVELLWRDYLDGAPFHRSDTHTTIQLLGNLDLLSVYNARLAYGRRQRKRLRQLDLTGIRGPLRGPYLWFHFISRSLSQQTARLVVDYNAFAIPLDRIAVADDRQIRDYVGWLAERLRRPADRIELPAALGERFRALPPDVGKSETRKQDVRRRGFQGTDFTALHFLSANPRLEDAIRHRYGEQLSALMRRDRRDNIRRVFRTYPLHRLPRERRSFNPLSFYQRHLASGWVLLFPFKLAWWYLRLVARLLRIVAAGVRDVLHPGTMQWSDADEPDPYAVAVRKIYRMRKPLVMECLRLRAEFDPEYLGLLIPGGSTGLRGGAAAAIEEDMALIAAEPAVKRQHARLAAERRRQVLEFRSWLVRFGLEGQARPSLRAMTLAYTIDYRKIRTRLEAARLLQKTFDEAIAEHADALRSSPWSNVAARCLDCIDPRRRRLRGMMDRLFRQPAFASYGEPQRQLCRRVVWERRRALGRVLKQIAGPQAAADPVDEARQLLAGIGRDPDPWNRELVTLRAVQTLSILDLKTYCDLVAELGEYSSSTPDAPGGMLHQPQTGR